MGTRPGCLIGMMKFFWLAARVCFANGRFTLPLDRALLLHPFQKNRVEERCLIILRSSSRSEPEKPIMLIKQPGWVPTQWGRASYPSCFLAHMSLSPNSSQFLYGALLAPFRAFALVNIANIYCGHSASKISSKSSINQ